MSQSSTAVAGACRSRGRVSTRPGWVRPYRRLQRALDSSEQLIRSSLLTTEVSECRMERRPLRTARELAAAWRKLAAAAERLVRATRQLAEAEAWLQRADVDGVAIEMFGVVVERWRAVDTCLRYATREVAVLQLMVVSGLVAGVLVPEGPADDRPRIILKPRLVAIRAFLLRHGARVIDRIAPILRRRRRTPRPAAIRVPRPSVLGRTPPLFSACLF